MTVRSQATASIIKAFAVVVVISVTVVVVVTSVNITAVAAIVVVVVVVACNKGYSGRKGIAGVKVAKGVEN